MFGDNNVDEDDDGVALVFGNLDDSLKAFRECGGELVHGDTNVSVVSVSVSGATRLTTTRAGLAGTSRRQSQRKARSPMLRFFMGAPMAA